MSGIIYLIQPAELLNTDRYKIGMSSKKNLDRIKKGYKKGTKWISINEVNNPLDMENTIKKIFTYKFTLIAGKEYFEGKIKDILQEYNSILLKHMFDLPKISDTKIINNNSKIINKNANIIQKWWVKLMFKYYAKIDEKFNEERYNKCIKYEKYLLMYEYDEVIDTYEKYIKYSKYAKKCNIIDDIIIINKVNKVGFIKFSDSNYYLIFGDNIKENLYGWINSNKYDYWFENNSKNTVMKKCKFCIDKLIKDIIKKCYNKNITFYKHKKYEYIVMHQDEDKCIKLCKYNCKTKKLSNIILKDNEILVEDQIIISSFFTDKFISDISEEDLYYYNKLQVSIDKKLYHIQKFRNLNI